MSKTEATQLLTNKLLGELLDLYKVNLFGQWMAATDTQEQSAIHARGVAVGDIEMWIESKAKEVINGSD